MLINYLPSFMQDIREIKKIMDIGQIYIDDINICLKDLMNDLFVLDATEDAVTHYEQMLGILPKFTDTLEKRKYDILAIYNHILPFTFENLKIMLDAICDVDGYEINLIVEQFYLNIKLQLNKKHLINTINELLESIVPMNLIICVEVNYNLWKDMLNHTWYTLSQYKWNYIKESEEL